MANRHLSRSIVFQALFDWDFRQLPTDAAKDELRWISGEFGPSVPKNPASASAAQMSDPFMEELLTGVIERRPDLDLIIEKAAPEWPISRISPCDRNILRLGLYELLFSDRSKVPAKVAINEAIELGKRYSTQNSGAFINGILDKIMNRAKVAQPAVAVVEAPAPELELELPDSAAEVEREG